MRGDVVLTNQGIIMVVTAKKTFLKRKLILMQKSNDTTNCIIYGKVNNQKKILNYLMSDIVN